MRPDPEEYRIHCLKHWPQSAKDAGYLEFLAAEMNDPKTTLNGLRKDVIARSLREMAQRIRENYADPTTGKDAGEDNVPH